MHYFNVIKGNSFPLNLGISVNVEWWSPLSHLTVPGHISFQYLVVFTLLSEWKIPGGGMDTASAPEFQFGLRRYLLGYANTQRVTQIPNGLRKYPTGYATSDSSFFLLFWGK